MWTHSTECSSPCLSSSEFSSSCALSLFPKPSTSLLNDNCLLSDSSALAWDRISNIAMTQFCQLLAISESSTIMYLNCLRVVWISLLRFLPDGWMRPGDGYAKVTQPLRQRFFTHKEGCTRYRKSVSAIPTPILYRGSFNTHKVSLVYACHINSWQECW